MICRVSEKSGKLEKMSKSKGNVVNPDILVNKFGTDSLRAYELFIGPPELDSEWDDSGIEGVYRWLRKVFVFVKTTNFSKGSEISREVKRYIHTAIQKITEDIERFHMNTIISTLMECFNNLQDYAKKNPERIYKESISEYILLMAPVVPHLAEELWNAMGNKGSVFKEKWPEFNPDFIRKDNAVIVIQVNGKVREKVELPTGSDQKKVEEVCFAAEKVKSAIEGKEIKKIIYVPDKILNIVVG
jgi:leucyl-tRNA synthetase